jgi:DNA-binding transcriptional LysR family regulator
MIDLRRMVHLVALADERHFGRAAERTHLSQPAFSRSIQALERAAGQRLFDRETSDVRPTPAGAFLIERARRLLLDARSLERDLQLYSSSQLGDVAFGVGPLPAATLMPRVLSELRRAHPQVALRVEVSNWMLLLDRLRAEDIEFFVADVRSLPQDPALDIQPLGRQLSGFFVRAGHPLARRACTPSEMWGHGLATTRLPASVLAALATILGLPAGRLPVLTLECDDVTLLRSVALSTDTVLGVSRAAVQADIDAGAMVPLCVEGAPHLFAEMGIVTLRHRSLSPMAQRAIDVITRVALEVNRDPVAATSRARGRRV